VIYSDAEWVGNISSTINAVTDRSGEEQELTKSIEAVEELVRAGLAVSSPDGVRELTAALCIELFPKLASNIGVDTSERLWI